MKCETNEKKLHRYLVLFLKLHNLKPSVHFILQAFIKLSNYIVLSFRLHNKNDVISFAVSN